MFRQSTSRREVICAIGSATAYLLLPRVAPATANGDLSRVTALLDDYVGKKRVAGAVAVIGTRKRSQFVSSGHVAFDSGALPAGPESLWRIYSMTKLVTGVGAMLLVEEGKLTLDMPVAEIFPSFASPQVLIGSGTSQTRRAKAAVTIRHLMTHTSGLVGSMVPEPPLSNFYSDRKLNVSRVSLEEDSKVQHQSSLLAFAAAAGTVPLAFDPGTQWSYGISSDVLGAVIEAVSGVSFEDFLKRRIFEPLGMFDTGFTVGAAQLSRLATNYHISSDGKLESIDAPPHSIFAKPPPFPYPSSGLISSARDFARFTGMLLGDGAIGVTRILKTDTARLMMSNLLPEGITAMGQGWGAGGLVLLNSTNGASPFGTTPGTYGWKGSAGTIAWVNRAGGTYAVLMTQYMPTEAYNLHADLAAAI